MDWKIYLAFALIAPVADAIACLAVSRKFNLFGAAAMGAMWPICIPMVLLGAAYFTRNMPAAVIQPSTKDTP